jgi:hypothetical protein
VSGVGSVRHVLNTTALNAQLRGPSSGVTRDLLRRALRVQAIAKRNVKADHGRLRNSIHVATRVAADGVLVVEVGSDLNYALAVHNGTGVYGPRATAIVPTHGKLLVFPVRGGASSGGGRFVFARSVQGQPANPYLKNALTAILG